LDTVINILCTEKTGVVTMTVQLDVLAETYTWTFNHQCVI